jgi:hypothetical protein
MAEPRHAGRAALGFSVHTGWAAAVAVAPDLATHTVAVLDRRRMVMIEGAVPDRPPYVYHAARHLPPEAAERLVREFEALAAREARAGVSALLEAVRSTGYLVDAGAILASAPPLAAPLPAILRSHALIHAAEGALFRAAIRGACTASGLSVIEPLAKDLHRSAAHALHLSPASLETHLARIGRAAGRPFAKDHREATLAAWVALSS